jgi:hypothetical protein
MTMFRIDASASAFPSLLVRVREPRHELRERVRRDVDQSQLLGEIAVRVGVQQAPILLARALTEAAPPGALISLDPIAHELA